MNRIYVGLSLSLFCVLLAYFILPTLLLVAVICVVLAGLHFKDDFTISRYVATHVASFYLWVCEIYCNLQNMYHQSNNTNFPVRKSIVNNGTVSSKLDRLHQRLKTNSHNLNSSYVYEAQPLSSSNWNSSSNVSPTYNYLCSRPQSTLQDMSRLNISSSKQRREETMNQSVYSSKPVVSMSVSPRVPESLSPRNKDSAISTITGMSTMVNTSRIENNDMPILDAKLYANINSPGFCSRVAERLPEAITHQPKYDAVGAFPVVHLKSQSPKIKIKTPVRVRLAPPTNDILYSTITNSSLTRPPMIGTDESMKSVLQVLKEISRKRIHSHVEEDDEDNSKRLRINESQYANDNVLHASLLQQTIQGKRAREDSSPNEDDVKKRRKPLQNNEILSSLSSSISVKPPHLKTKKRKAQDDAVSSISGLGNLLKVRADVTPPLPPALPPSPTACHTEECEMKVLSLPTSPSQSVVKSQAEQTLVRAEEPARVISESDQDGAVSRLLGRMSSETEQTSLQQVPVKKNVFMSTNDLSLSPPKENRLAAMIAVLGGPSENLDTDNVQLEDMKQPERNIIGKALFTSPATPDTPKKTKKVTFNDTLTMTKIYERDQPDGGNSCAVDKPSVVSHSTPLSSLTFGVSSCPTPSNENVNLGSQITSTDKPVSLNFGSPLFPSEISEPLKQIENVNSTVKTPSSSVVFSTPPTTSILGVQAPVFMQPTSSSATLVTSSSNSSVPTFTVVSSPISSSLMTNENKMPAGLSFGPTNSSVKSQQETTTNHPLTMDSVAAKPFSFVSDSKPSQAVSSSAFPSLFTSASPQNVTTKSVPASELTNVIGQNKPNFNIFTNKDATVSSPGSKKEEENKLLVNGFSTTTASDITPSFAFNASVTQAASNKSLFPIFGTNTSNTTQAVSTFNFGSSNVLSTSSATTAPLNSQTTSALMLSDSAPKMFSSGITISAISQHSPALLTSTANQPAQPINMFSNALSSSSQAKPSPFGGGIQASSQGSFVFGDGNSQIGGAFKTISSNTQSNMFGGLSTKTEPKPAVFGATVVNTSVQPPNQSFGLSTKPASSEANGSPFGMPINSATPQSNTMFGDPSTTAKPATLFGNVSSNTSQQNSPSFPISSATSGQQSLFNNANGNSLPKAMFQNPSTTTTGFGAVNKTPVSTFGNQNNIATSNFGTETNKSSPAFGSQNNSTTAPSFGNPNNTIPSFGNQNNSMTSGFRNENNSLNNSQSGFNTSATFSIGTNPPNSGEVKPPVFNSSPFVFGNPATNKDPAKPFGTAAPFSFSSNIQQPNASLTTSAQPSLPTFGASNTGFGTSLQPQAFGTNIPQPTAPTFSFGQGSSAPGVSFQFNATTPQPLQGGGMFSIGSGSTGPRSKTTGALRRRHKPT